VEKGKKTARIKTAMAKQKIRLRDVHQPRKSDPRKEGEGETHYASECPNLIILLKIKNT